MMANKRKMARYRSRPKAKLMKMAPEKMSAWKERRGELGVRETSWLQFLIQSFLSSLLHLATQRTFYLAGQCRGSCKPTEGAGVTQKEFSWHLQNTPR